MIKVKHSGRPATGLLAGYAGGQGKRFLQEGQMAAQFEGGQRRAQFAPASSSPLISAGRGGGGARPRQRDPRRHDRAIDRLNQAQDQRPIYTGPASGAGGLSWEDQFGARRERDEAMQAGDRPSIFDPGGGGAPEYHYTPQQREEVNSMYAALDRARETGQFTGDEIDDMEKQINERAVGVSPRPRIPEESPYPSGQGVGETWVSDDGHTLNTRDDKGNVRPTPNPAVPTMRDMASLQDQAMRALTIVDGDGEPKPPSPEDVRAYVEAIIDLRNDIARRAAGSIEIEHADGSVDEISEEDLAEGKGFFGDPPSAEPAEPAARPTADETPAAETPAAEPEPASGALEYNPAMGNFSRDGKPVRQSDVPVNVRAAARAGIDMDHADAFVEMLEWPADKKNMYAAALAHRTGEDLYEVRREFERSMVLFRDSLRKEDGIQRRLDRRNSRPKGLIGLIKG